MSYTRILIIRMSALGDVIMTLPCLSVLRKAYPSAHISWLVNQRIAPLLEGNPLLNEVICFDRELYSNPFNWPKFLEMRKNLKSKNFDLAIDFQGLFKSAYLTKMSKAPVRVGSAENREGSSRFYTHRVDIHRAEHHGVDWQIEFLKGIPGIKLPDPIPVEFVFPDFRFAEESVNYKLRHAGWDETQNFVIMAPGARWETKKWLPERFAKVGERIYKEFGYASILIGTNEDQKTGSIIELILKKNSFNLIGKTTLPELALLMKRAKIIVANDTGPMHLATALGTPVIAIFGPTDSHLFSPYGDLGKVVKVDVPCGPCHKRVCPGYNHVCMTNITSEQVYSTIHAYLK